MTLVEWLVFLLSLSLVLLCIAPNLHIAMIPAPKTLYRALPLQKMQKRQLIVHRRKIQTPNALVLNRQKDSSCTLDRRRRHSRPHSSSAGRAGSCGRSRAGVRSRGSCWTARTRGWTAKQVDRPARSFAEGEDPAWLRRRREMDEKSKATCQPLVPALQAELEI